MMHNALASSGLSSGAILGIGVSLWASVDPSSGVVSSWTETPTLSATLKDFAIRDALQAAWQSPHIVVDDIVRNLGIAEVEYGHHQGNSEDFLFALADTGIGLAIMLAGAPYVGPYQIAGEIGHIPMAGVTIPCNCGNTGCLETVASVNAIMRAIHQRLSESNVRSTLRNIENQATIQDAMAAAESGDKLAYQVITEAGQYFGSGLATAVNLLGPKMIIVGGTLAKSSVYLDAARRNLRLQALSKISTGVRIEPSQLDDLAGARGAAARVLNKLFEPYGMNLLAL
jgi:predicted NBD/HSP70 family sugar kinase